MFPFEEKIETQKKLTAENRENLKIFKAAGVNKKASHMDGLFENSKDFKERLLRKLMAN